VLPGRVALGLLLVLALLHGALYAVFLPPWGLIDEAQHVHYIQVIAEEQSLPVAGERYLSDEIIASLFATRRWETFHWTPPPAPDPQVMGLEGHSYEAYQPPLFYLLMAPLYLALPDDMLVKVYALRAAVVLLSLVTVWAAYRSAATLLPQFPPLPFWVGLVLVAIPERAMATSRVNNDVLLEVGAALLFLVLTQTLIKGMTRRRALLLGLLLGLCVWVKISAGVLVVPLLLLLWLRRNASSWRYGCYMALASAPFAIGLAARNLWIYGDLTGFGAFDRLHRLAPTDTSLGGMLQTLVALPNHIWLVWWKGSHVGGNVLLTLFYWFMAVVVVTAWMRLGVYLWRTVRWERRHLGGSAEASKECPVRNAGVPGAEAAAVVIYAAAVLVNALALLSSYYDGMVPVVQGRFMLPALVPFVMLLVWGLWLLRQGGRILLTTVLVLWGMGLVALFGNLVLYFYYWSEVLLGTMPPPGMVDAAELLHLVYLRAMQDKPARLAALLWLLPLCYALALGANLFLALRWMPRPSLTPPHASQS
jgi:hypothetical protein